MEFLGIDTETINGKCRLIGLSDNQYYIVKSIDDLWLFLNAYSGINFIAYNADYDIQSMLIYLPKKELGYILLGLEVEYNGITFLYYKKKFLKFTNERGTNWIFDVYQFYRTGTLDDTAKKFLGRGKESDVDASKITEKNIYTKKLINYCIKDAKLAYDLFMKMYKMLPKELANTRPISQAFYAAKYFRKELTDNMIPNKFNILARSAYHGGLFTINTRGHFDQLYNYDIVSAYPYEICKLRSMKDFSVVRHKGYIADSTYSFFQVRVDINDKYVGPLFYKLKGLCLCPVGKYEGIITKCEYERIKQYDPEIIAAVHIYCKAGNPFKERMEYIFSRKCNDENKIVWKYLANSLYGKTAAHVKRYRNVESDFDTKVLDTIEKDGRNYYKVEDIEKSNFVYASEITAQTRMRMYDAIKKYREHIIMVQTDSLVSDIPLKLEVDENKLGAWKLVKWDEAYMIGSGVYFYRIGKDWYMKYRGFNFAGKKAEDILAIILASKESYIDFDIKKHISLVEARRTHDDTLANMIVDATRRLNINFDKKRIWLGKWTSCKDIQTVRIPSIAVFLKDFPTCENLA
jgi:hypothetical protein